MSLSIVKPNTVVYWHSAGIRIHWNRLSRRGKRSGRPPLPREVRALIRKDGHGELLGAPRIHGELLCLGLEVSEHSVSRYGKAFSSRPARRGGLPVAAQVCASSSARNTAGSTILRPA